ncbi:hypothetical protein IFT54_07820 [Sphingomonas sp. CFBP 13714]|uniref:hypothetical protein n=1 Tax=Sphingomonas sp. CFBP 13714 TaxID=2775308 RepID=UPI00178007AC|nr:hypothetical protein [Sphingomonas sp. CFBP 13714]MBD8699721.1 hypothetical protein [Sphingomonas sp. CFBP 13714]
MHIFNEEHGTFYNKAYRLTLGRLEMYGSLLSNPIRFSISSLILALDSGLRRTLPSSYYLSSLPPGTGKTEAISSFITVWRNEGFKPDSSIILCFQSKEEIRSMIGRLDLDDSDYACYTTDDDLNVIGRGKEDARSARILFTTQQMIISRTKTHKFCSVQDLFYMDGPRPLRIWDESMTLAKSVTVRWTGIVSLYEGVQYSHKVLGGILSGLIEQGEATDESVVRVPKGIKDAAKELVNAARLDPHLLTHDRRRTLEGLIALEGRSAWRVAGDYGERALVGATKPLPDDFAPAIITDASGAVRGTYEAMERGIGGLVRLPYFSNDYSKVRIHLWTRAAGRKALGTPASRDRIFRAIAKLIATKPEEEWLVIGPKTVGSLSTEAELASYFSKGSSVSFLNWGRHHGTNRYRNVKNVIVVGTFTYPKEEYTALEIAASGVPLEDIDGFHWNEMRETEIAHNMLQGMLRGNARNSDHGVAHDCDIYLIAPASLDMERVLSTVFPNAAFDEWGEVRRDGLTGQAGRLLDTLKAHFADPLVSKLPKQAARIDAGIGNTKQGLANVLARSEV